jgi:hypothetical protein
MDFPKTLEAVRLRAENLMAEPTEYTIVWTTQWREFEADVNRRIKDGWRLQGGISGWQSINPETGQSDHNFAQALVR